MLATSAYKISIINQFMGHIYRFFLAEMLQIDCREDKLISVLSCR